MIRFLIYIILLYTVPNFCGCSKHDTTKPIKSSKGKITYVGRDSCITCHEREYQLWQNSHHDRAMEVATENTVLGDFNNSTFTHFGITSRFYRRDGNYYVYTEGADGRFKEFKIAYTFGFFPLQQYLIAFPNGRYQVLGICWDTRPQQSGGQKWFHIYPDERIAPGDVLFWTRVSQNWNYMCAECHSTNFQKNYFPGEDYYESSYSEIDVSCESCHGPGSEHIYWARHRLYDESLQKSKDKGLKVRFNDSINGSWVFTTNKTTATKTTPPGIGMEVETCGRCHSRRTVLTEKYYHGKSLLETHRPALLTEDLYFADGQILEEVYVYGSFLQSKMYHNGVTCHDCHDPHGLTTFAKGNALCYRCHLHEKYGSESHHHHKPDSAGADCADCHMPERTYMVIDPRRDHSIRIPRPDISERIHSPNACNQCHKDKTTSWSIEYVKKWYGNSFIDKPHYGMFLFDGRRAKPGASHELSVLIGNSETPPIVKATALELLRQFVDTQSLNAIEASLSDINPLLRLSAVDALDAFGQEDQARFLKPMMQDSFKVIRAEAGRLLSALPEYMFSQTERTEIKKVIRDYIEIQAAVADNPGAQLNLGILYMNRQEYKKAEKSYRQAIHLEPEYPPAYINLADLYRQRNQEKMAEKLLREALQQFPDMPEIYYALGLSLVRQKRNEESLTYLEDAVKKRPKDPHLNYVYGIALNSQGKKQEALSILSKAIKNNPFNTELLYALSTIYRDEGKIGLSLKYAQQLSEIAPDDQGYQKLLQQIKDLNSDKDGRE